MRPAALAFVALSLGAPALADMTRPAAVRDVEIEQRLGQALPLDAVFRDEDGRAVSLGDSFGKRPVVLSLAYFRCPMLCTEVLNGLTRALNGLPLEPGRDFDVVTVSFDPTDGPRDAAMKRTAQLEHLRRPETGAAWRFLTGDEPSIRRLTEALGYRTQYDPARNEFGHAAAIFVVTPDGKVARYLYGIEYAPRDLKLALVEASAGRIGTLADRILLLCFHWDPTTGKYGGLTLGLVRIGGVLTVLGMGAFVFVSWRRERATRQFREGAVHG